jgi:hypothetical protein
MPAHPYQTTRKFSFTLRRGRGRSRFAVLTALLRHMAGSPPGRRRDFARAAAGPFPVAARALAPLAGAGESDV